ncbi:unnamed protein product [Urochloa humidicola]
MINTLQQVAQRGPGQRWPQEESLTRKLEGFHKLHPPTFDSSSDPLDADDWLKEIEKKLDLTTCTDVECVTFAAHKLTGAARAWWDGYCDSHPDPANISWDEFVEAFTEHHIPEALMDRKAEEFRKLTMGSMTVQEYTHKFQKLMRYAPDDTDTEKKKIYCYKRGLHRGMKLNLEAHDFTSLHQLIGKALRVEKVRMECADASLRDRKRKAEQFRSGPSQRPRLNTPQPQQQRQRSYPPPAQ